MSRSAASSEFVAFVKAFGICDVEEKRSCTRNIIRMCRSFCYD